MMQPLLERLRARRRRASPFVSEPSGKTSRGCFAARRVDLAIAPLEQPRHLPLPAPLSRRMGLRRVGRQPRGHGQDPAPSDRRALLGDVRDRAHGTVDRRSAPRWPRHRAARRRHDGELHVVAPPPSPDPARGPRAAPRRKARTGRRGPPGGSADGHPRSRRIAAWHPTDTADPPHAWLRGVFADVAAGLG